MRWSIALFILEGKILPKGAPLHKELHFLARPAWGNILSVYDLIDRIEFFYSLGVLDCPRDHEVYILY